MMYDATKRIVIQYLKKIYILEPIKILFFNIPSPYFPGGHGRGGKGGGPPMPMPPKTDYFMASSPDDDCSTVPEVVTNGWPMKDACKEVLLY